MAFEPVPNLKTRMIPSRLSQIHHKINQAVIKAHLNPNAVKLIAVSKKKEPSLILKAYEAGQLDFGENYSQELIHKAQELKNLNLRWHFIGHLQKRKVKDLVGKITLIHSVDSWELACEINKQAQKIDICQDCLVQIHLSHEQTKSGLSPEFLDKFLIQAQTWSHIRIKGLMTLPPYFEDPEQVRPYFRELRQLKEKMNQTLSLKEPLIELSMGMSHDFEIAIEEGATLVRIGTALFGNR